MMLMFLYEIPKFLTHFLSLLAHLVPIDAPILLNLALYWCLSINLSTQINFSKPFSSLPPQKKPPMCQVSQMFPRTLAVWCHWLIPLKPCWKTQSGQPIKLIWISLLFKRALIKCHQDNKTRTAKTISTFWNH